MSLEELKTQCIKKGIDISEANIADDYVGLLLQSEQTDWGWIYCKVLYHTGMPYEEISRRTIPQINAILEGAGENLAIKTGKIELQYNFEQNNEQPEIVDNDTRLAQLGQLERMFNR